MTNVYYPYYYEIFTQLKYKHSTYKNIGRNDPEPYNIDMCLNKI